MAMSFAGVLLIGLLIGPMSGGNDLASQLDPEAYFTSRGVEVKAEGLTELAGKQAKSPKELLQQLLAMRWLGEQGAGLGANREKARAVLSEVAKNQKGFAKEYAEAALARLDGKTPSMRTIPADSVRTAAFAWFPDDVSMVGSIDMRRLPGHTLMAEEKELAARAQKFTTQIVPAQARTFIFQFAEAAGNIRIDRVSFAFADDPTNQRKGRIFIRLTGQAEPRPIIEYLKLMNQMVNVEEKKGPNGEAISLVSFKGPPVLAFVDNTDLLVLGYDRDDAAHTEVLDEVLAVMGGKKGGVVKGPLSRTLQAAAPEARGVFIGALPKEPHDELKKELGAAPTSLAVELLHAKGGGLEVRVRAGMADEADAKKLVQGFKEQLKNAEKELASAPPTIQAADLQQVSKFLQSIELKADGATVTGRVHLSTAVQLAGMNIINDLMKQGFGR